MEEILEVTRKIREEKETIEFTEEVNSLNTKEDSRFMTINETRFVIKALNNKKSAGMDGLSNFILRKLPEIFWGLSTVVMNNCIANQYFPSSWKQAVIIPLPKTTKAEETKDFRPISMLSNWGKILEVAIIDRMTNDDGNIEGVPDFQFGYKKGHSAVHAVDLLYEEANNAWRRGMSMGVCSIDISKAFDSVWAEGLIYKVQKVVKEPTIVGLISSFMTGRRIKVRVGESVSEETQQQRGVPQGSKLGPILYCIYTADIVFKRDEKNGPITYADDTLKWVKSRGAKEIKQTIEAEMQSVVMQMGQWGIKVNGNKTKFLTMARFPQVDQNIRTKGITIDGKNAEICDQIKYLGNWINSEMTSKDSIDAAVRKGNMAFSMVGHLMRNQGLSKKVKALMYTMLVRPTMTYGTSGWNAAVDIDYRKLLLKERRFLRTITGLYRRDDGRHYPNNRLYEEIGLKDNIQQNIEKLKARYEEKKKRHPNEWFRSRMETLQKERDDYIARNKDYWETERMLKEQHKNEKIAASIAADKRGWKETFIEMADERNLVLVICGRRNKKGG